jgi:nucleotide-binding universal stress UspA family protein
MDRLKNLTFAVDFSAWSRNALAQATRIALGNGTGLQALHVVDSPAVSDLAGALGVPVDEVGAQAVHTATHELERWVQQADALQVRMAEFVSRPEAPELRWHIVAAHRSGQGMAGCARQIKADLIIVGARGRTNLRHVILGPTAERLLRVSPGSVLTMRAEQPRQTSPY